jgi:hypothetical protein
VKAHRDIHAEKGLNDFPTHVVDVEESAPACTTGWSSLAFP